MMRMPKTLWMPAAIALCLALVVCERERDEHEPIDPGDAVSRFCKAANKKLPRGSHVVVLQKDIVGTSRASGRFIHREIMEHFTERRDIYVYDDDNAAVAYTTTDNRDIFTVIAHLEKWEGTPYHKSFFSMYKNDEEKAVISRVYAITTDDALGLQLWLPPKGEEDDRTAGQADDMASPSATAGEEADSAELSKVRSRSRGSIERAVMYKIPALSYAYRKRLRDKPGLSGKIVVKFAIDESGRVISAQIVESTTSDPDLENAVVSNVKKWDFGEIDKPGDVTEVTYPFVFKE